MGAGDSQSLPSAHKWTLVEKKELFFQVIGVPLIGILVLRTSLGTPVTIFNNEEGKRTKEEKERALFLLIKM